MLSPNVITACDQLVDTYNALLRVDSFAYSCISLSIGVIKPDPLWAPTMRNRLSGVQQCCKKWQMNRPEIVSGLLTPIVDYQSTFIGFTAVSKQLGSDATAWINALSQLRESLESALASTKKSDKAYDALHGELIRTSDLLKSSLVDAWNEVDKKEQELIDLSSELAHLYDHVDDLSTTISRTQFDAGKNFIETDVSMTYDLMTAAEVSVPYLAIATMVYTIGKSVYDVLEADKDLRKTMDKISALRLEMSEDYQALAFSKTLIKLLYTMQIEVTSLKDLIPELTAMWSSEIEKMDLAINALKSGARPEDYFDLKTMSVSSATWQTLADYVPRFLSGGTHGEPVHINIGGKIRKDDQNAKHLISG